MHTASDIQAWLRTNDDEPDERQFAIWNKMTAPQKLALAFGMYDFAKGMVRSSLKAQHPELTAEQVEQMVRQRFTKRD
jgi:hypothetical protein